MSYLPQLDIRDYAVERLLVESNPSFEGRQPTQTTVNLGFRAMRHATEARLFRLELNVILDAQSEDPHPYSLAVTLAGYFESRRDLEKDAVPPEVVENSLAILYGIARGVVGSATGNCVHGRYTLPSVTFRDATKEAVQDTVADAPEHVDDAFTRTPSTQSSGRVKKKVPPQSKTKMRARTDSKQKKQQ